MGAACSSSALNRYNSIKRRLNQKTCMTFHSADGLLPRVEGAAAPMWFFGEDHGINESDILPKNKRNCAILTDLVQQAVSSCEENGSNVILVFENVVVSDNKMFFKKDPNDVRIPDEKTSPHHDVRTVRRTIKEQGVLHDNISTIYMDVFGRIRMAYRGALEGPGDSNYIFNLAFEEMKEFWLTSGRYGQHEANYMAMILSHQANTVSISLMNRFRGSKLFQPQNEFRVFMSVMCSMMAKLFLVSKNGKDMSLLASDRRVIQDIDSHIEYLLRGEMKIHPALQSVIDSGNITSEQAQYEMFDSEVFGLIVLAGDAILYEYLSTLDPKNNVVVMHAGHGHTNNQRKWLLSGKYVNDFERVTSLGRRDYDFMKSRLIKN